MHSSLVAIDCMLLMSLLALSGFSLFVSQGAVIGIDDEDDSTFTITVDQKTFHFQGELKEGVCSYPITAGLFVFAIE